ncbi:MAG: chemotaxis protein CheB, partial [Pseudomonadota bacterium]
MDDTDHKDFEEKPIEKQSMFWVGIGASAGGLEALRALVRKLPSDLNATYIVAQHLSPHHRSMFPEIIGRETDFEVLSVSDSVRPKPNKIYITPQNKDIEIVGDQLKLMSPSQEAASPKPSVDRFFRSLAREKGNAAVAIVLSGTGSDGSRGVREVRAEGGIVIAQDDLTAKYSGMPVAAVESGAVDIVMSPEEIGAQFGMILERRRDLASLKDTPVHLDGVSELIHLVHNQARVNFRYYKAATLQRRIERRMAAIGVSEIEDYVSIARTSPKEVDALFRDFLISVTSFFRDPAEFDSLRTFIREIIDQKPDHEPIRVWVPGAATGEEVYSIAMLFADELGGIDQFSRRKVQLFATDIDRDGIEQARRAFYSEPLLDAIPANFVPEYFDKVPTGYVVKKAIRERVIYSVHDVTKDPPFLKIDLVACRNLLIYFQSSLQAQVLARLHYAMVNQGILFLGKSETTSAAENLFRAADQERHIFYKRAVRNNLLSTEPSAFQTPTRKSPEQAGTRSADVRELTEANARFDSLVASIGPDGFLVGADLHLKRAYGNVNPYIEVGSGDLTLGISNLLKEPYGQDIRSAVPIVIRKKTTRRGIAHRDEEDPTKRTRVSVYPIDSGPDSDVLALAIIHSWHEDTEEGERDQTLESSDIVKQNDELRRELAIAQTNLQQTSEELETSNEELQALNEELQSSNEELQSTNEELETSNEELQSTNEELSTVNEELQVSSHELRLLNESLKSILLNIGSPLIVVDRNLNIVHISHASETLFQIDPQLELPHLSTIKRNVGFPDIAELANEAINKNIRVDRQVKTATMDAMVSVVPNVTEFQKVSGAIILVTDNTSELKKTRDELQLIFDNIPQGIFVRKHDGALIKSNPAGRALLGADDEAIANTDFLDFFAGETVADLKAQDEQIAENGEAVIDRVGRFAFKDGRMTWIRYSQLIVDDEENDDRLNYLLAQDISAEHEAQIALTTSEERLGLAVDAAKIGLWDLDIQNDNLWWSDTFKSIVGLDEATFSGKDDAFYSRLHPEDTQRVRDAVDAHLNGKAPYDLRYRLEKK